MCIGPSPTSARLIHAAHRLASQTGAFWMVVTVDTPGAYATNAADRQRVLAHIRLADSLGAQTLRLSGRRISREILLCAQKHAITRILVGKPTRRHWISRFRPSPAYALIRNSGDLDILFVAGEGRVLSGKTPLPDAIPVSWQGYAASFLSVLITTVLAFLGRSYLTPPDLVMLYLLPIMTVAFRFGRGPALLASAFSVAAYDFFFVHPYLTFMVSDSQYVLTFTILFVVGIVISSLMTRIRQQEREARERERQTDALHRLGRDVMSNLDDAEVASIVTRHATCLFGGESVLCLEDGKGGLTMASATPDSFQLPEPVLHMMRESCHQRQSSKPEIFTLPEVGITCLPISTSRVLGVLALRIASPVFHLADRSFFLEAFAHQASLAMDRARLSEAAKSAAIRAKEEELRGTLLSMASHDLRTPLAAIIGAGTTLLDEEENLNPPQQKEMLETICVEASRMDRLITNLLDMVRVESGGCHLRREWIPFDELLGSAMERLEERLQGRQITVQAEEQITMVYVDPVFFVQVLVNLLDNALKYTPAGSPIVWTLMATEGQVAIRLSDRGMGIPPGEAEHIFEKFVRGETAGVAGSGLGLAICRGVVQTHDGTIQAMRNEWGGADFLILLPQPPLPTDLWSNAEAAELLQETGA
ncbi:MAG: DUF4118 domain-containing protein [Magnetococcus sp. YQC-3]